MSLELVAYTEKSLAVFGNTKSYKDHFTGLGGKFNPALKKEGVPTPGWIFAKTKQEKLQELLNKIKSGQIQAQASSPSSVSPSTASSSVSKPSSSSSSSFQNQSPQTSSSSQSNQQPTVTNSAFLSLVARVEKLEQENALLKLQRLNISTPTFEFQPSSDDSSSSASLETVSEELTEDGDPVHPSDDKPVRLLKGKKKTPVSLD
jgi:hypothetical protein